MQIFSLVCFFKYPCVTWTRNLVSHWGHIPTKYKGSQVVWINIIPIKNHFRFSLVFDIAIKKKKTVFFLLINVCVSLELHQSFTYLWTDIMNTFFKETASIIPKNYSQTNCELHNYPTPHPVMLTAGSFFFCFYVFWANRQFSILRTLFQKLRIMLHRNLNMTSGNFFFHWWPNKHQSSRQT